MVYRNLTKNVEALTIHTLETEKRLGLAELIFEVTGEVWDRFDEESSEDEGHGIHAYLGVRSFEREAVESLEAATTRPPYLAL